MKTFFAQNLQTFVKFNVGNIVESSTFDFSSGECVLEPVLDGVEVLSSVMGTVHLAHGRHRSVSVIVALKVMTQLEGQLLNNVRRRLGLRL